MWIRLLAIALFIAQVYLTFNGIEYFDKYQAPVVLYAVSMGIVLLFLSANFGQSRRQTCPPAT